MTDEQKLLIMAGVFAVLAVACVVAAAYLRSHSGPPRGTPMPAPVIPLPRRAYLADAA